MVTLLPLVAEAPVPALLELAPELIPVPVVLTTALKVVVQAELAL